MTQKAMLATGLLVATVAVNGCLGIGGGKPLEPVTSLINRVGDQIVGGAFAVAPRTYTEYKFAVPEGSSNPQLEGTFSTTGGANNDIEVLLLEETQFLNWQNRLKFTATYESGRVTADRIRLPLPDDAAAYVMVFSNRFSIFSSKDVKADVKLQYERGTR